MIYVNKKLKYMFDSMPTAITNDENTGKEITIGKLVYAYHGDNADKIKGISYEEWDVAYKNGNIRDNCSENLELVIFKDDKFFKENEYLRNQMLSAKKDAKENKEAMEEAINERMMNRLKIDSLTKQVSYEQNRVKELNKELNKKEKEIRRLMDILNER